MWHPLQDMQAQAGHANPSTTLLYAEPGDAKTRRALVSALPCGHLEAKRIRRSVGAAERCHG